MTNLKCWCYHGITMTTNMRGGESYMIGPHLAEVFLYIPKPLKSRLVAVVEQREGLSLSKVGRACIEACIDGLEEEMNLKPKPVQGTRSRKRQAA